MKILKTSVVAGHRVNGYDMDREFDEGSCLIEEEGHDMEAKLKMDRRSHNRFFELESWWPIEPKT